MRLGAASWVGRVGLEDGPGSTSELRDLRKGIGDLNDKNIKKRRVRGAHGASDGLFAPFYLNLLAFVRQLLLHGTGPSGRRPRLARKGIGMTVESRLGGSTLRVAIE